MNLDARSRTHIQAVADEFKRGLTEEPINMPGVMFLSGVVTGLAAAVQIADGASGEKAAEDIVQRLNAAIGRAYLDGELPARAAAHDGPTVREAAADDRRWPLEKEGE